MINATLHAGNWLVDFSNPLIIVTASLLMISLLFTLRASWRRLYQRKPARALVVAVLNILACSTLVLLLTEPRREHLATQNVVLISEGANLETFSPPVSDNVYVAPGAATSKQDRQLLDNVNWLLDVGQLNLREPALAAIQLHGYGLDKDQWQDITADVRVDYQATRPVGFTQMQWPRSLVSGETLQVSGRYWQAGDEAAVIELRLLDPAGKLVNVARARNGDRFRLVARPRSPGNLAYRIQAWQGDTLQSEQMVAVSVVTAAPLNIMVEQSAPSFETRALKNFAAADGARVLINTQISLGKSISQSANLPDGTETTFSPGTLATQDVLIMDGRALVNLNASQRQWLTDAIERGLGLVILADASLLQEFDQLGDSLMEGFVLEADRDAQNEVVPYLLTTTADEADSIMPIAAMEMQASSDEYAGMDILVSDGQGRVLVAMRSKGLGHVAISLINQSYGWLTSGKREEWSNYWSSLFASVGRPQMNSYLIPQPDGAFYSPGEKTPLCVFSGTDQALAVTVAGDSAGPNPGGGPETFELPLAVDALGSPRQCAWFWPQNAGWHQVQLRTQSDGVLLDQQTIYIVPEGQWLAQKRQERVTATLDHQALNTATTATPPQGKMVSESLNVFWLWLLLIVTASLLWLERKLDSFPAIGIPIHLSGKG